MKPLSSLIQFLGGLDSGCVKPNAMKGNQFLLGPAMETDVQPSHCQVIETKNKKSVTIKNREVSKYQNWWWASFHTSSLKVCLRNGQRSLVAQAGFELVAKNDLITKSHLELVILLPPAPESWDYRCAPPPPVYVLLGTKHKAVYMLSEYDNCATFQPSSPVLSIRSLRTTSLLAPS